MSDRSNGAGDTDDPWLWLEEVHGPPALDWVRERNAETRRRLEAWPAFADTRRRLLEMLDSSDRIPTIVRRGAHVYNFWQDAAHPRGLWRRTTLGDYRRPDPPWELLLDLDALAGAERENWVWGGADCLGPDYTRALLRLSRGGADAQVAWQDRDTLYVGTDFGPGSLTDAGYPRSIRRWRRGQPLQAAETVFEARTSDVAASVHVDPTPGFERTVFSRAPDFFSSEDWLLAGDRLQPLPKPADAQLTFWYGQVLLALRSDWDDAGRRWPSGALLACEADTFLASRPC
jgi:prolyl oligopeptidase